MSRSWNRLVIGRIRSWVQWRGIKARVRLAAMGSRRPSKRLKEEKLGYLREILHRCGGRFKDKIRTMRVIYTEWKAAIR